MYIFKHMLRDSVREELAREKYETYPTVKKPKFVLQHHVRGIGYREDDKIEVREKGKRKKIAIRDLLKNDRWKNAEVYVHNENPFSMMKLVDRWEKVTKISELGEFRVVKKRIPEEHEKTLWGDRIVSERVKRGPEEEELQETFKLYDLITESARLKIGKYLIGHSYLDASSHGDLRWQITEATLNGLTLLDPGRQGDKPLLSFEPGMGGKKILCEEKAVQPLVWLTVGSKGPVVIEPGEVGSTKYSLGVMYVVDKGWYEMGALKPGFIELFLHGERMKGRWVARLVPLPLLREGKRPKKVKKLAWNFWCPKEQEPYAVSARARKKGWVPPKGIIPIPKEWREKHLDKYNEWLKWVKKKWEELGEIEEEEVPKRIEWRLILATWKGAEIIRGLPNERWFLQIKRGDRIDEWKLHENPFFAESIVALKTKKATLRDWKREGKSRPNTRYNESKTLEGEIVEIEKGKGSLLDLTEEDRGEYILELEGKEFGGIFRLVQDEKGSELWILTKEEVKALEQLEKPKFSIQRHWWGDAVHFDLSMQIPDKPIEEGYEKWALVANPLKARLGEPIRVVKYHICKDPRWFYLEADIPPGEEAPEWQREGNPTKNLVAHVRVEDKGTYTPIERTDNFRSFILEGKKIRGYYVLRRFNSDWYFIKARLPKTRGELREGEPWDRALSPPRVETKEDSIIVTLYPIKYFSSSLPEEQIERYDLPPLPKGVSLNLAKYPREGTVHGVRVQSITFDRDIWSEEKALAWIRENRLDRWLASYIRG